VGRQNVRNRGKPRKETIKKNGEFYIPAICRNVLNSRGLTSMGSVGETLPTERGETKKQFKKAGVDLWRIM